MTLPCVFQRPKRRCWCRVSLHFKNQSRIQPSPVLERERQYLFNHICLLSSSCCVHVSVLLSEGLSGVELSDLTLNTEPLTHVVRGLSRKKPQRVFSVSAFEEQFDQLPGASPVILLLYLLARLSVFGIELVYCICFGISPRVQSHWVSSNPFSIFSDNKEDISRVFHKGDVSQEKGDASQDLDLSSGSKR